MHMSQNSVEHRLEALRIELPRISRSGNRKSYGIVDGMLFIPGQLCYGQDGTIAGSHRGKVGRDVDEESAREAARLCILNVLGHAQFAVGSLDRIRQCVRLGGFINAAPDFKTLGFVMDGASNAMVEIMGAAGHHSRTSIGVAELPEDACVEVEALFVLETGVLSPRRADLPGAG